MKQTVIVNRELLNSLNACTWERDLFLKHYPEGLILTLANLRTVFQTNEAWVRWLVNDGTKYLSMMLFPYSPGEDPDYTPAKLVPVASFEKLRGELVAYCNENGLLDLIVDLPGRTRKAG